MIPLVVWIGFIGYTIAFAGWKNLGVTYSVGSDGKVHQDSKPLSLLDAMSGASDIVATPFVTPSSGPGGPLVGVNGLTSGIPGFESLLSPLGVAQSAFNAAGDAAKQVVQTIGGNIGAASQASAGFASAPGSWLGNAAADVRAGAQVIWNNVKSLFGR